MIKHQTTRLINPHRNLLPPGKRIFGYFFCNRKKSLARKRAARGEMVLEVEVEVEVEV